MYIEYVLTTLTMFCTVMFRYEFPHGKVKGTTYSKEYDKQHDDEPSSVKMKRIRSMIAAKMSWNGRVESSFEGPCSNEDGRR